MITVLVVDRVLRQRQCNSRICALAVQAAIMITQSNYATQAVSRVLAGSGDRDVDYGEFRTSTILQLSAAPVLISTPRCRGTSSSKPSAWAGEMASAPCVLATKPGREAARAPGSMTRFSAQVRVDLALHNLNSAMRSAVRGDDPADASSQSPK